jgi:hypothetical protein
MTQTVQNQFFGPNELTYLDDLFPVCSSAKSIISTAATFAYNLLHFGYAYSQFEAGDVKEKVSQSLN